MTTTPISYEEFSKGLTDDRTEQAIQRCYNEYLKNPKHETTPCVTCNTLIDNTEFCRMSAFRRKLLHKFKDIEEKPYWYHWFSSWVVDLESFNVCDNCLDKFEECVLEQTKFECPECERYMVIINYPVSYSIACDNCDRDVLGTCVTCFHRKKCDYDLCYSCYCKLQEQADNRSSSSESSSESGSSAEEENNTLPFEPDTKSIDDTLNASAASASWLPCVIS